MALKLLRCETDAKSGESVAQPDLFQPVSGLEAWCVRGWESQAARNLRRRRQRWRGSWPRAPRMRAGPSAAGNRAMRVRSVKITTRDGAKACCSAGNSEAHGRGDPGSAARGLVASALRNRRTRAGVFDRMGGRGRSGRLGVGLEEGFGGPSSHQRVRRLHADGAGALVDLRGYPELDAFSMNIDSLPRLGLRTTEGRAKRSCRTPSGSSTSSTPPARAGRRKASGRCINEFSPRDCRGWNTRTCSHGRAR